MDFASDGVGATIDNLTSIRMKLMTSTLRHTPSNTPADPLVLARQQVAIDEEVEAFSSLHVDLAGEDPSVGRRAFWMTVDLDHIRIANI